MKKLFVLLFIFIISGLFAQNQQKTGYVDSQIILAQFPPAIKAQSDLDALAAKWQKARDSMVTVLQNSYQDYEKQREMMSPDKQKEVQQQLVLKQQDIQRYEQQKFGQPNGELYKKNEELLTPIKQKIMDAIAQVAKDEKMTFVFDKSGDVLLLYAEPDFDITYKVLDRLKRGK